MNWIKKLSLVTGGVLLGCSVFYFAPTGEKVSAISVTDPSNEVTYKNEDETEYKTFDLGNAKIGVISDVHFNKNSSGVPASPFENSVKYLKKACAYFRRVGAEIIILDGDVVDHAREDNYQLLADTLVEIYGSKENAPELIFNMGNHEFVGFDDETSKVYSLYSTQAVYGMHKQYLQDWVTYDIWDGVEEKGWEKTTIVKELDDVTVIGYNPDTKNGYYSAESVAYLDSVLAQASQKSNKPIVLSMHIALGDYVAGGWCEIQQHIDVTRPQLQEMLGKYPNVVTLTGHSHISTAHGRNISQDGGYTAVNVGPLVCMGFESYLTNSNGTGAYAEHEYQTGEYKVSNSYNGSLVLSEGEYTDKANTLHEGLLLSFGADSMKIDHVNVEKGEIFKQVDPYYIPYGITTENKAEKHAYVVTAMKAASLNDPLTFAEGARATLSIESGKVLVTFPSVEQYTKVEAYQILLKKGNEQVGERIWVSDAITMPTSARTYRVGFHQETYGVVTAENLSEYSVEIIPFDFFGNRFVAQALRG